jgi:argininosuccinate synthase
MAFAIFHRCLKDPHIATMDVDPAKAYNQDDATGFIRLNALRLRAGSEEL